MVSSLQKAFRTLREAIEGILKNRELRSSSNDLGYSVALAKIFVEVLRSVSFSFPGVFSPFFSSAKQIFKLKRCHEKQTRLQNSFKTYLFDIFP